ncbi:valacyclovir hydrolase isoform X1 [Periplaneta americana]|uniref:valacyclovir hydrolase isoform X1 n=1 Tax=Periplaneta americana TaxID=6978 RepID=UPI0037E8D79D
MIGLRRISAKLLTPILRSNRTCKNFVLTKYCSSVPQESKITVNGIKINYVKVGNGPKPVLCLPGAIGSIWSDFKPQVESLDRTKFTVVAWDPPGYGNSRPPTREFPLNFLEKDADWAVKFMQALSINRFSMLGWSDGGMSAMILASKYPDLVDRMVIWGGSAYIIEKEVKLFEGMRDVSTWSERMRAPLEKLYGKEEFAAMWGRWVDAQLGIYKERGGDILKACLPKISCPTLIVHGSKDPMVAPEHPPYLVQNIRNSRLHVFEEGKHNLHLRFATEFNALVTDFLTK